MAFCKFGHFKLVSRIFQEVFELVVETCPADRDDKQITWTIFEQIPSFFLGLRPFVYLDILNLSERYLENYLS